jgi:hypothetical protein
MSEILDSDLITEDKADFFSAKRKNSWSPLWLMLKRRQKRVSIYLAAC